MDFTKIFKEFPVIETQKIRLRKLRLEDAPTLLKYYSNENVYRNLDWNGPETLDRSYEVIKLWNKGYVQAGLFVLQLQTKSQMKLLEQYF